MTTKAVQLPAKLVPVFQGQARYRIAYGGRGSGKSRGFALMCCIKAIELAQAGETGVIVCLREYINTLADSSMAEIKNVIKETPWLQPYFDMGEKYVRTKDRNIEFLFYGLTRNLDSLKSLARIHIAWVDEAARVTEEAWRKLIPSVREPSSEIWVTFNPEHKNSSTDKRFRQNPPTDSKWAEVNYMDNPWFPDVLEQARKDDKALRPETYAHIWLGDYLTVVEGSYYDKFINEAKESGRVTFIPQDNLMGLYTFWDIGGTGAKADSTAIWVGQFIGKKIHLIDYCEGKGQPLSYYVDWLRKKRYDDALHYLPHDGRTQDKVFDVSFESSLRELNWDVEVVPNQGTGAAMKRIDQARRLFTRIWFDAKKCEAGIDALKFYHSKIDEHRGIDLGPNHDWSSHAADAFGLMAVVYEEPRSTLDKSYTEYDTAWVV
jgi:phage terminase large subunit